MASLFVTAEACLQTPPAGSIHTPFEFNGNVGNLRTVPIAWFPVISKIIFFVFFSSPSKPINLKKKTFFEQVNMSIYDINENNRFFIIHNYLIMTLVKKKQNKISESHKCLPYLFIQLLLNDQKCATFFPLQY